MYSRLFVLLLLRAFGLFLSLSLSPISSFSLYPTRASVVSSSFSSLLLFLFFSFFRLILFLFFVWFVWNSLTFVGHVLYSLTTASLLSFSSLQFLHFRLTLARVNSLPRPPSFLVLSVVCRWDDYSASRCKTYTLNRTRLYRFIIYVSYNYT